MSANGTSNYREKLISRDTHVDFFQWDRLRIFLTWGIGAIVGFPVVYGTCNYFASLRGSLLHLWWDWELQIPFIPEFVWIYLSLNIVILLPLFFVNSKRLKLYCQTNLLTLFIGGIIFLVLPCELGFSRQIPNDPLLAGIFQTMFFQIKQPCCTSLTLGLP